MKKRLTLFLTAVLLSLLFAFSAFGAGELWDSHTYPLCDPESQLEENLYKEENRELMKEIPELEFDIVTFVITDKNLSGYPLDQYVEGIYKQNGRGYGVNHDGIFLGMNADDKTFLVRTFGRGQTIFGGAEIRELSEKIREGYSTGELEGAQTAFRSFVKEAVKASSLKRSETEETYESGYPMAPAALTDHRPVHRIYNETLPDWYIKKNDLDGFKDFHNDSAEPRVIDLADIFTASEETEITERVDKIRAAYGKDLVIYTDTTNYGIDNERYAEDFYVFNGYGTGDTYDGMVLFVNMDPENREMVTCARGSVQKIHTKSVANQLDDILYDDFKAGTYGNGVLRWLDAVDGLYHYGDLNMPEWYRQFMDGTLPADASSHHVVDDIHALSEEELQKIETTLKGYSDTYGRDCVVYISDCARDPEETGLSFRELADDWSDRFYRTMGYGAGEQKSGVLLTIYRDEFSDERVLVHAYGDAGKVFTKEICSRLASITDVDPGEGKYAAGVNRYLYYLGKTLKTGHLPHTWPVRCLWLALCAAVGAIVSAVAYAKAEKQMKVVKKAVRATDELVPGSLQVLAEQNILLGTRSERVLIRRHESSSRHSSSGSSSGRSSYSSHSHSSSGASFSSSRRKF